MAELLFSISASHVGRAFSGNGWKSFERLQNQGVNLRGSGRQIRAVWTAPGAFHAAAANAACSHVAPAANETNSILWRYAARHQNLPSIFWLGSVPPELLRARTVTRARFEQEDQEWLARALEAEQDEREQREL
jgi:hypothetical protein